MWACCVYVCIVGDLCMSMCVCAKVYVWDLCMRMVRLCDDSQLASPLRMDPRWRRKTFWWNATEKLQNTLCLFCVICDSGDLRTVERSRTMSAEDFLVECHRKVAEDFVVVLCDVWFGRPLNGRFRVSDAFLETWKHSLRSLCGPKGVLLASGKL